LTNPPPFNNRHGMTLVLSTSGQLHKVPEELHAEFVAFFRMKLGSHDILPLHGRDKAVSIVGCGQNVLLIVAYDVVGMNKIESYIPDPYL